MRIALVVLALAFASACSAPPSKTCDQRSCAGCCDAQGACQLGNSTLACGSLGGTCQLCQSTQSCALGQCVTSSSNGGGTGGGSSNGGGTGGGSSNGGGTGGGSSNGGGTGGGSSNGGGTGGGSTGGGGGTATGGGSGGGTGGGGSGACSSATCSGCCVGNVCQLGTTTSQCGANGAACTTCGTGLSCQNGRCQGASCGPGNCPTGCCQSGACLAGTSVTACGVNGATCTSCGSGNECVQHQCQPAACGPGNCSGCCDMFGICQSGTANQVCGTGGNVCQACGANTCTAGQCGGSSGVTPSGGACTDVSQCAGANDIFGLKSCISPVLTDGGPSGWVGGACSASCFSIFTPTMCPSAADYCNSVTCYQSCTNPGGGQSSCRTGYVCATTRLSDGGVEANSAHCQPNCNNAPAAQCGTAGTCLSSGYCQ